ncbi:hypothetical protein N1851_015763 [Merluccius polli]|uniref:DDE Tnp4 domain-containing protein n=1 Tax=Merluccius polli TaxID=89951 RepID=A0AA47P3D9_MERPO|nr:hypothetical protein N1851_015763 [Merluccius polli]
MPCSTVHRIVHRVTEEVVAIRHKVIHLPKTPEDLEAVPRGHIRIKPPSGPDGQCYRTRKLFPSIILQAVCDHEGRFIDTYVRVLRHSPLYRTSLYPPPGHFILADGGYLCLQHPTAIIPGHAPL